MINLIPPKARKQVTQEYWVRVASVWLFLASVAVLVSVLLAVPVYFLVNNINVALSGQFDQVKEQQTAFAEAEADVKEANALIAELSSNTHTFSFTEILDALDALAGEGIEVTQVVWSEKGMGQPELSLVGIAADRTVLSSFVSDLNEHQFFEDAELPISNLVKDRNISFSLTVLLEGS